MAAIPQPPRRPLPYHGPPFSPVEPTLRPLEYSANYPFADAKEQNPNLFPPVCLRSHWDPTKICSRTLPTTQVATPLDPRPWTRVCMNYVTTQDFEDAPRPSDDVVFPMGGTVYPPSRYREAIDSESALRRLDRPLGTCERDQYTPSLTSGLYRRTTLPTPKPVSDRFVQELAFPMVCLREGVYDCRAQAEKEAWDRSPHIFNNTTKQDRYGKGRTANIPVTTQFKQVLN